jgi:DNA-binding SARP family transcriptional activator/predicted ATPase
MTQLHLAFLGSPEVKLDDQRLAFPTRKTLALLIYLVVEEGLHSREKLQTFFWPDSSLVRGRGALRTTLAYLRRVLATAVPQQEFILSEGDTLGCNPEVHVICDVHVVASAVLSDDPQVWQTAVAHCRSSFLEGFSLPDAPAFDEWLTWQRQQRQQQANQLFQQLTQWQGERRLFAEGITTANQWLALDSLNEAAHRRLMQLHFMAGDRTAAWQAYITCQSYLADELGIEPSAETKALAERIRAEKGDRGEKPTWLGQTASALPFVGRAVEHGHLATAWQTASQGQAQAVVIVGEAGIGKTRLATEFLQWTAVQGSDIWQGRAFEAGGRLSYQPVIDALRERLEQENAPDDLLSDVWLAELGRLLPELYDRYPDLPPPTRDESLARTRLLEAVVRLGIALTSQGLTGLRKPVRSKTVIFFIDDIQWADDASLDLLHYALRRWVEHKTPMLLLLNLRTESLATTPSLKEWLAHLGRHLPLTQLELGPISAAETAQLVAEWEKSEGRRAKGDSPLADWLYRETTGQPFFIAETLKALRDRGLLNDTGPGESFVPTTVRQLILARLQGLSPQATDLLTAAAVIGRHCRFERLCQIAALPENVGLAALDQLLNGRLLSETPDLTRPYQVAHDKIRDVAYTEAGDARRRIYHRRAFQALEKAQAPAAELAHHALAAHLPGPSFRYSLAAGDAAMSLFAVRDAIAHYEQARQLSIVNRQLTIDNSHYLYAQLSRAYELAGQYNEVQTICEEMLELAQRENQPMMVCAALNRLASIAIYSHHLQTAETYLQQALQIASQSQDKAALAQTHWSLSQLTHHQGNFRASKEEAELALALARELEDAALIAGILNNLGHAQGMLADMAAAEVTMTEAARRFRELGNKALEADSLVGLTMAHLHQGQTQAGIAAARTAYLLGREIENDFGQCMSRPWLAFGLVDSGAYEEALALAQQNLLAARPQGGPPLLLASLSLGLVYWFLGLADEARQAHQENEPIIAAANVRNYTAQNQANFCADAVLAGDWALAGEHARHFLAYQDYTTVPLIYVPLWPLTAALLHNNAAAQARADVQRWAAWIGRVPRYQISYHRSLALLAEHSGQADQASHHLEKALKLAELMALPGEQWQILARLSQLYRAEAAASAKSEALEIVNALAKQITDETLRERFVTAAAGHLSW